MYANIILIGPMSAGKSTIAAMLSEKLGMERFPVDENRWDYYDTMGYDKEKADAIHEAEGLKGILAYWKPFEAQMVVKVLTEQSNMVIDFGAGHSVFDDEGLMKSVRDVLAPFPNVILLLPSPDDEKSIEICFERFMSIEDEAIKDVPEFRTEIRELIDYFVKHPANRQLAKITVYTEGKTPEQTRDEVMKQLVPVQ